MNLYDQILNALFTLPTIHQWPELQELLRSARDSNPRYWLLPGLACEAVGGDKERALAGMAAIAALHTSIVLIDDMLDADDKGAYHCLGQPATANCAAALQAAGLAAMTSDVYSSDVGSDACRFTEPMEAIQQLNQMVLTTALGQVWDGQPIQEEERYWQVVRSKSAPFFATALEVGALLGGAERATAKMLAQVGGLYGEMVQIHDDLHDVMETPANPDWTTGRTPLPILFAQLVPHPKQKLFAEVRQAAPDATALAQAQEILIECGAVSYSIDQLLRRYQQAQTYLTQIPLPHPHPIADLLESSIAPVEELMQALGLAPHSPLVSALFQPPPALAA